jgi:hypothetical protein
MKKLLKIQSFLLLLLSFQLTAQTVGTTTTPLNAVAIVTNTAEIQQSKIWTYAGKQWTVLGTSAGSCIYRLDGSTWTNILVLATGNTIKADIKVIGNLAHIMLYKATTAVLYSVEYDIPAAIYKLWTVRKTRVDIAIGSGVQIVTIDIDGNGRMWMASDGAADINVRWSDSPYSTWSTPVKLESNTSSTDLCAVIALPLSSKVGVFWSNKSTKRFGFKTHTDGADPATWTADEIPSSQSALNVGAGFAENQFNIKVSASGRLYASIKTAYNTSGNTQLGLLVRQPSGTWDAMYPVTVNEGLKPVVLINDLLNEIKVAYTSASGSIEYRQSASYPISFEPKATLISGSYDNVTTTKNSYNPETVVMASNAINAVSVLLTDSGNGTPPPPPPPPPQDVTPPDLLSIDRRTPSTQTFSGNTVTYRATFSEEVTGVIAAAYKFTNVSGTISGTLASGAVTPVGTTGTTYNIDITSITGDGTLRLDLKSSGTGIKDVAGNAIAAGFTSGQTYIYTASVPLTGGFQSVTKITPVSVSVTTKDKPQSKVWNYDNKWWTVLSVSSGTKIYRLDGTTWTSVLTVSSKTGKNDVRVVGNVVHILIYSGAGSTSYLYSIEYVPANNSYKLWTVRPSGTSIVFPSGSETANFAIDGTGRIWAASAGTTEVYAWWCDYPYSSWSSSITIASGIKDDDICTITALPNENKVGILWSNQTTKRFGFRTHTDGTSTSSWSSTESPAASSAIDNIGQGMSDDHLNLKVHSDGTLYCATKTGYNKDGYAKLTLLIRRPGGPWDNLYTVTMNPEGTQPAIIINEARGTMKIIYCTVENGGDLLYRESSLSTISFGPAKPLFNDGSLYDYPSTSPENYNSEIVIIATNLSKSPNEVVSVLASDVSGGLSATLDETTLIPQPAEDKNIKAATVVYPNPFSNSATLEFALTKPVKYSVILYDARGMQISVLSQGYGVAGVKNPVRIDGISLAKGMYFVQIQTSESRKTIKLIKK